MTHASNDVVTGIAEGAGTTACHHCPLRAMQVFKQRSDEEVDFIQRFKAGERVARANQRILDENQREDHLYTVLAGWVFRYRTLEGNRRQIINFGLPGDFLGLQATLDDTMSHGIETLTDVRLCLFKREQLWELYGEHPRLAYDITWLAAQEERSFEEQLLTLGQRTAFERIATCFGISTIVAATSDWCMTTRSSCRSVSSTSPTRSACRWCTPTRRCRRSGRMERSRSASAACTCSMNSA